MLRRQSVPIDFLMLECYIFFRFFEVVIDADKRSEQTGGVTICSNKLKSLQDIEVLLQHELTHAEDHYVNNLDLWTYVCHS